MKNLRLKTKDSLILLASGIFALLLSNNLWHVRDIFLESIPILLVSCLLLVLIFLTIHAGLVVLKSLFVLGAELSLVVFLAQSYCGPGIDRTVQGDSALMSLLVLSLTYISYRFLKEVFEKLKNQAEQFRAVDGKWSKEAIFMFLLLFLFVGLFMYMLYLVISPIILGLCVYRAT